MIVALTLVLVQESHAGLAGVQLCDENHHLLAVSEGGLHKVKCVLQLLSAGRLLDVYKRQVENRERYDYRQFLRKFAVLKEEMQVDPDSFDTTFYTYGLSLYGNMPLIEPLESREIYRIEDFVIVIDTSMSCSGDLVKRFLEETYDVLSESESYFRKIQVHILQCDDKVQSDRCV